MKYQIDNSYVVRQVHTMMFFVAAHWFNTPIGHDLITFCLLLNEVAMLSVQIAGSPLNPAIVLTHGVTDNAHSQADLIDHLSPHFQVFAIDTLGHGTSPAFSAADLADPFEAAATELTATIKEILAYRMSVGALAEPLIGHGHSMGGALLSFVAHNNPEFFRLLILEAPAWLSPEQQDGYLSRGPDMADRYDGMKADPVQALAECYTERPHWPVTEFAGWLNGKFQVDRDLIRSGVVTFSKPWQEVASSLTVPTYIMTSENPDTIADHQAIAAIGNPQLHIRMIANAPHSVRREDTELYHQILADIFLAEGIASGKAGNRTTTEISRRVNTAEPYIDPRLSPIIEQTPPQTPWDLVSLRAGGTRAFTPSTRYAPDSITVNGTRIFNAQHDADTQADTEQPSVTIINIHGGGYVAGSAHFLDEYNHQLAKLPARIVCPDYRLAPEYPYPAAITDIVRDINELTGDEPLILMGDSAGAGLAWSVLAQTDRPIAGLVLLEPAIDPTLSGRSFSTYADGPIWTRQAAAAAWQLYAGQSPSVATMQSLRPQLPRTLVVVNPVDPLRDEGIQLALDLTDAGAPVSLHMLAGTFHGTMKDPVVSPQINAWISELIASIEPLNC